MAKTNLSEFIIPLGVIGLGVYLAPQIKTAFQGVGQGVSTAAQGTGQGLSNLALGTGTGVGTGILGIGQGVNTAAQGLGFGVGTGAAGIGTGVSSAFQGVGQGIGDLGESIGNTGGGFISKVGETGGSFLDIFQNTFQGTADTVENFFEGANNPRLSTPIRQEKESSIFSSIGSGLKNIFTNPIISPLGFATSGLLGTAKSIISSRNTNTAPAKVQEGISNSNSRDTEKKARAYARSSRSSSSSSRRSSSKKSTYIPTAKNFSSVNFSSPTGIIKLKTGGAIDTKRMQSITVKEAEKRNSLRSSPLGKLLNI